MSRVIEFEGVANARDLGGPPGAGGRRVVSGRLFRAGSLHEMTDADRTVLSGLGIRVIVDLRADLERARHPYVWSGGVVRAPLVKDELVRSVHRRFAEATISEGELEDWWTPAGVFRAPEDHAAEIGLIFRTLVATDYGVLFHCRTGKDRTGLVAALILTALGVSREDVMTDFLLSNDGLSNARTQDLNAIGETAIGRYGERARFSLTGVRAEWLDRALDGLSTLYGSVESYLEQRVGFGREDLERLRSIYLAPGA